MKKLKNEEKLLFGTKVYDYKNKKVSIILKTWDNTFSTSGGGSIDIKIANCVDYNGKLYKTEFANLTPLDNLTYEEKIDIGLIKTQKDNLTLSQCENKLIKYYKSQQNYLEELRERWQDEYKNEDPKEYEKAIIESAKKKNIEVLYANLSKEDFSLKIAIKLNDKYVGHIDIFRIMTKTYIQEKVVNYVVSQEGKI